MKKSNQRAFIIAALAYLLLFVLLDTFVSIPMIGFLVLGIMLPYLLALVLTVPLYNGQKPYWKLVPLLTIILACTYEVFGWLNMPKEHLEIPLFILAALSLVVVIFRTNLPLLPNILAHFLLIRTTFLHNINSYAFQLLNISTIEKPGAVYFYNYWETKILLLMLLLYIIFSQHKEDTPHNQILDTDVEL